MIVPDQGLPADESERRAAAHGFANHRTRPAGH